VGFHPDDPLELNHLIPEDARMRSGDKVEEANVLIWRRCAQELAVAPTPMLRSLEELAMDTVKWSRKAPKETGGLQNKRARHNCCFTDLQEPVVDPDPGDVTDTRVRHKHPKNPEIKFANFGFKAVKYLEAFRARLALVLGPFGYKVAGQFAELRKSFAFHYDVGPDAITKVRASGIGRHGDVERAHGASPGSVNCLKLGAHLPLLFAWYRNSTVVGRESGPDPAEINPKRRSYPLVPHSNTSEAVASAVVALGHGDFYSMSEKAIGFDWKKKDWALRHCAGGRNYTKLPKAYYENLLAAYGGKWGVAYSLTFSDCVENDSESPELQFRTPFVRGGPE
jgi:hypothetical protein